MLPVYLGTYIFVLVILWGFFLLARHHSYKFKNMSTSIVPVTNILFFVLLTLSFVGLISIFMLGSDNKEVKIDISEPNTEYFY